MEKKPNQYTIPAVNLPALREKLAKLNKAAEKLGCEPVGYTVLKTYVVKRVIPAEECGGYADRETVREMADIEVTGTAPKLAGWEFIGRIELENGLTLMYPAPGKEIPKAFRDEPHHCDHCNTKRSRVNTFVVAKPETGEAKRVGSNCLTDFLGHKDPAAIARYLQSIHELIGSCNEDNGSGWSDPMFKLADLIPQLAAIIRVKGWVTQATVQKAVEQYGYCKLESTRQLLVDILNPFNVQPYGVNAAEERAKLAALREACKVTDADLATLEPVKASIAARNGDTDFDFNLKQLLRLEAAPVKQWGLLAAAVGMWFKEQGRLAERAKRKNEYVPGVEVGSKVELELTVTGYNVFDGSFGTTTLHRFTDGEGRTVIWFSSRGKIGEEGKKVKVKGTVKALEQYKDLKQTVLTRVKELA